MEIKNKWKRLSFSQKNTEEAACLKSQEKQSVREQHYSWISAIKIYGS